MPKRSLLLPTPSLLLNTLLAVLLAAPLAAAAETPIKITADLSEAPRRLYHAEIDIPVKPGPLTLITPEWIPGNHRPTGPVEDITGVVFTANGETLKWRRDDVNLYEFHLTVPRGVSSLHAHLDCIVLARVLRPHGGAGVGEAAALSRRPAGQRDCGAAERDCARGLGDRHRAAAHRHHHAAAYHRRE